MSVGPTPSDRFFKFLRLSEEVRTAHAHLGIGIYEERLLNAIAVALERGERLTVVQAMNMPMEGSPTTKHRCLKRLKAKKLLHTLVDERDQRVKYLALGPQAQQLFGQFGRCMLKT